MRARPDSLQASSGRLKLGINEFLTLESFMGGSDRMRVHARRAGDGWDILRRVVDA